MILCLSTLGGRVRYATLSVLQDFAHSHLKAVEVQLRTAISSLQWVRVHMNMYKAIQPQPRTVPPRLFPRPQTPSGRILNTYQYYFEVPYTVHKETNIIITLAIILASPCLDPMSNSSSTFCSIFQYWGDILKPHTLIPKPYSPP